MSTRYVETPEQELLRLREQNRQWLEESTKWLAEFDQLRKEIELKLAYERLRAEVLIEREACAKVCKRVADGYAAVNGPESYAAKIADECAAAIRARGENNAT